MIGQIFSVTQRRVSFAIAGKKLTLSKSYPHLAVEWHQEKNGDANLDAYTHCSNKKVWWQCTKDKGHEWSAPISNRVRGRGCPFCSGNLVNHTNSLRTKHPKLAEEWDYKKNGKSISPETIFFRSTKKVFWKCKKGPDHEWKDSPRVRAKRKKRCLFCDGQELSVTNSLQLTFPELSKKWHPTKNKKLTPKDVTYKSHISPQNGKKKKTVP